MGKGSGPRSIILQMGSRICARIFYFTESVKDLCPDLLSTEWVKDLGPDLLFYRTGQGSGPGSFILLNRSRIWIRIQNLILLYFKKITNILNNKRLQNIVKLKANKHTERNFLLFKKIKRVFYISNYKVHRFIGSYRFISS